jgi:hypothetical protein
VSRRRWVSSGCAGVAAAAMAFALSMAAAQPSRAEVVTGIGTVEAYNELGHEGYWRYCLDVRWDTAELGNHAMSFVNVFIGLGACPCACGPGMVVFPEPAGVGVGEDGCEVLLTGIYDCHGDPHFPENGPSIKFEPAPGGCEPGSKGSAQVCFYSMFSPAESTGQHGALGIKSSTWTITGDLTGTLPVCLCASATEESSWGMVKALYR